MSRLSLCASPRGSLRAWGARGVASIRAWLCGADGVGSSGPHVGGRCQWDVGRHLANRALCWPPGSPWEARAAVRACGKPPRGARCPRRALVAERRRELEPPPRCWDDPCTLALRRFLSMLTMGDPGSEVAAEALARSPCCSTALVRTGGRVRKGPVVELPGSHSAPKVWVVSDLPAYFGE